MGDSPDAQETLKQAQKNSRLKEQQDVAVKVAQFSNSHQNHSKNSRDEKQALSSAEAHHSQ